MPVYVGGAELNVATALARWGLPVQYCTAVPDNYLSQEIIISVQEKNIDVSAIQFLGSRIGTYYLPRGADLKNAGVIYDRACSSFSELKPGVIDWEKVLSNTSWLHFSAISPALNENVQQTCKEALETASKKGITISVDLNYRSKLWKYGKKPIEVMPELVQHCHVIMGNIWAANDLLGIPLQQNIHDKKSKEAYLLHAKETSLAIMKQFQKCKVVANTFRFDNREGIHYYASLDKKEEQFVSTEFTTDKVVDKVGSGDCFMAGLIYGLYNDHSLQDTINYAAAAAIGKLQEKGDATAQTAKMIKAKLKS